MLKREIYLKRIRNFYDSDLVKILVGIRRCGKTCILNQIIDELKENGINEKNIIYINFEYLENEELTDIKKLNSFIKSNIINDDMHYLFFDEIQNVENFEIVINSLRASLKNVSIFITGSNSKLLADELSTVLSGRYVKFDIWPLCYKEYIDITNKNGLDQDTFNEFLIWGGLPNVLQFDHYNAKKDYLHGVFDSIILRDVVGRFNLQDLPLFNSILDYLIDTTGREFSPNNIIEYLTNNGRTISTKTLYCYLDALSKALIIKKINRYDVHGKLILSTLGKYYMTDLGIAKIRNVDKTISNASSMENIVCNELLLRGYDVFVGKTKHGEVDFIAKKDNIVEYYQITYQLNNEETINREFGAYDVIKDNFPKYVLSLDNDNYSKNGILHKNILSWLLEEI